MNAVQDEAVTAPPCPSPLRSIQMPTLMIQKDWDFDGTRCLRAKKK
jgi:hypothetical protein